MEETKSPSLVDKAKAAMKKIFNRSSDHFVAETLHLEDTENFFEKYFDGEHRVFHEIISQTIHIDIHIIYPTEDKPYYLLFTTGMSDLPMTLPKEFNEEDRKNYSYGELCMLLPPDWQLDDESLKDEKWYWPIRAMKIVARYVHECNTFICHGHDLQFTEPCEPFAENTKLCALLFACLPSNDLVGFTASDGCYINIYCCIPIYEEELKEKITDLNEGGTKLLLKLFGDDFVPLEKLIVDIDRENVSAK